MHPRLLAVLILGTLFLVPTPVRADAPQPPKVITAPPAANADPPAGHNQPVAPAPESLNSIEGLAAVVIVVGLVVVALLVYLLTLGIPGKLNALQEILGTPTPGGTVAGSVTSLQAALGAPAAGSTVSAMTAAIQTTATQIQNSLGTPAHGGSIVHSLGRPAQADDLHDALSQVQTTLNQALQEISLIKGASETVLSRAWTRLSPGMPPPFAPQISSIDRPSGDGTVAIAGRNLSPDCRVWFGARDASPQPGGTANLIRVRPPAGQSGSVDVCIQTPAGLLSAPCSWDY